MNVNTKICRFSTSILKLWSTSDKNKLCHQHRNSLRHQNLKYLENHNVSTEELFELPPLTLISHY